MCLEVISLEKTKQKNKTKKTPESGIFVSKTNFYNLL